MNEKDSRSVMTPSEDTKDAVITFALFHFESLRQDGVPMEEAKLQTAEMLREVYETYCQAGDIKAQNLPAPVKTRINKLVDTVKSSKEPSMRAVYNELVQIQAQLNGMR